MLETHILRITTLLVCAVSAVIASVPDGTAAADALRAKGDLEGARKLYESILTSAVDNSKQAGILESLGETELAMGKYADAIRHGIECARLFRAAGLPDQEISCLTIAGRANVFAGQYPTAAALFEKAAELARSRSIASGEVAALNNLGNIEYFLSRYSDANIRYNEALSVLASNTSKSWYSRSHQVTLVNLATLYQRLGQYERALKIYRDLERNTGTLRSSERGQMLSNVGVLYRRLGDPYKAIQQYETAQELFEKDQNRDGEIGVIKNTGIALANDLNAMDRALPSFQHALRLAGESGNKREIVQAHLYLGETLRRLGHSTEASQHSNEALRLATVIGATEETWKAAFSLGKIEEDAGRNTVALDRYRQAISIVESMRTGISSIGLKSAFLGDKRDVFDAAIRVLLREAVPDAGVIFRYMEQGRARTLKDRLSAASPALTIADVQGRLSRDTAMLEYWMSSGHAALIWITASASGVTTLASLEDEKIDMLVEQLRSGKSGWAALSREIGAVLLSQVPASMSRLIIVPDGKLQSIPFEALGTSRANKLLIDDYTVNYLPSASMVGSTREGRGWNWRWGRTLVAFADPVSAGGDGTSLFGETLQPLPGTRDEVRQIASTIGGAAELHTGPNDLKKYADSDHLRGARIVHFATHGIADSEDPDRSRLAFSPPTARGTFDYLFAREIYDLNLSSVRMIVLAACDTETGQSVAGEGVAALSRAFLSAGAQSTISTLWRIGDRSSAELMRRFYLRLSKGETVAAALRRAKLDLKNSATPLAHPRYWAPYVLNGDAGTQAPRTIPDATTTALALIAGAAATVEAYRRICRRSER